MDVINPLEKILETITSLIELADFYKPKLKWFESCGIELKSISEIIKKFKDNRKTEKPFFRVCFILLEELEAFKDFLEKEKKISTVVSFFKESSIIREGKDYMCQINSQIYYFNMNVEMESRVDSHKNMKKLIEKNDNFISDFKKRFRIEKAAELWILSFNQEEQVSFYAFKIFMTNLAKQTAKIDLNEEQMGVILKTIDRNLDHLVQFHEWDFFYEIYWSDEIDRTKLLKTPIDKSIEIKIKKISSMILKVCQVNKWDDKSVIYPINHEFRFSQDNFSYIDYKNAEIIKPINWERDTVVFGKNNQTPVQPDVLFHPKSSINYKQFHISYKSFAVQEANGYYVQNLSTGVPTCLKVEKIPYVVESGMLFILANTYLFIEKVKDSSTLVENSPEYFWTPLYFQEEDLHGDRLTICEPKKIKKGESIEIPMKKNNLSSITISSVGNEGMPSRLFDVVDNKKKLNIKVGSHESCDLIIPGLAKIQMNFRYLPEHKAWFAVTDEECCIKDEESNGGNYLVLMHGNDFFQTNQMNSKAGSISVLLRKGMKIEFNENELEVL